MKATTRKHIALRMTSEQSQRQNRIVGDKSATRTIMTSAAAREEKKKKKPIREYANVPSREVH